MAQDVDIRTLSDAALIRAVADGEVAAVDPEVAERLAGIADADARIAFEQRLRAGVARAMVGAAPQGLRDRLLAAFERDAEGGPISTPLGDTRATSFWVSSTRWFAAAAVLTLIGLVIVGGQGLGGALPGVQRAQLINFVYDAHHDCESCEVTRSERLSALCHQSAAAKAKEVFGRMPMALAETLRILGDRGLAFEGLGPCDMPGEAAAVHLLFKGDDRFSSLFIQSDDASLRRLGDSCCYARQRCKIQGDQLTVWRSEGFIFYFYSSDGRATEAVRAVLHAPETVRRL